MYESQTFDMILKRMLEKVPSGMDKREGSIIYDATAPAAIEFELLYYQLDWFIRQSFGDTAIREFLIRLALERGLEPDPATQAVVKGQFNPSKLEVEIGSRFSLDVLNYTVIERLQPGIYLLQCETAGIIGNQIAGTLIPIDYIQGLETAELLEVTIPGEDEEDTEVFRTRYLASFNNQGYGGNIADYKAKVHSIDGVGGVKVYPVWRGGGTVRVVYCTSEFKPPTSEFVDEVQTILDPIPNNGLGIGVAPIGHYLTVEGAADSKISVGLNITFVQGVNFEQMRDSIEKILDDYFLVLNKTWENTQIATTEQYSNEGLTVRISQIESRILELSEVIDIQDTRLNGQSSNLVLGVDELAVRGDVSG